MTMGVPNTPDTFWATTRRVGECLEWQGRLDPRGYAKTSLYNVLTYAHRHAWMLANGPIPEGLYVLHRCDNPPCVNPDHLFLGTHADNMRDKQQKNRAFRAAGELNGRGRLTVAQVREIRQLAAAGVSRREIGRRYGIWPQTATYIVNRLRWRSVD